MKFNPMAFILLAVCALLPDLLGVLLKLAISGHSLPYQVTDVLKEIAMYPWQGVVFGLAFGTGCYVVLRGTNKMGLNEVVALAVFVPIIGFLVPRVLFLLTPFLGNFVGYVLYCSLAIQAGLIALVVTKGFQVEFGTVGVIMTFIVGLIIPIADSLLKTRFGLQAFSYTLIGSSMAIWVSFSSYWGLPEEEEEPQPIRNIKRSRY